MPTINNNIKKITIPISNVETNLDSIWASVAAKLLSHSKDRRLWIFKGELGAAKTTCIKALCSQLGVKTKVTSPTFSLINIYDANGEEIYHFDFYRIKNIEDAIEVGAEEYIESGSYCFIEWADVIKPILPKHYVLIELEKINGRTLHASFL